MPIWVEGFSRTLMSFVFDSRCMYTFLWDSNLAFLCVFSYLLLPIGILFCLMFFLTAKLILIDPLRKYSVQPLCLCWCLYKQPLPNLELAYFSNMCDFREADVNTGLYLMSAPMCQRLRWPWYSKKVVVHKSNKYSMLEIGSASDLWPNLVSFICIHKQSGWTLHSQSGSIDMSLAVIFTWH